MGKTIDSCILAHLLKADRDSDYSILVNIWKILIVIFCWKFGIIRWVEADEIDRSFTSVVPDVACINFLWMSIIWIYMVQS